MPKMAHFTLTPKGEGYALVIECEASDTIEILANYDQLDALAEMIDQQLDADDDTSPPLPTMDRA